MKTYKILTAVVACLLFGIANAAPTAKWATEFSNNNSPALLTKANGPQANTNREALSSSYKLEATQPLNFDSKPFIANSRQFWLDSTGNKLAAGIDIPITGGETMIRISALTNDKSVQLSADAIQIQNNGSHKAIAVFADSAALKATGAAFSDQTIALKINTTPGYVNLKVDTANENTPYIIHVLEKGSPYVLSLHSSSLSYAADQTIGINVSMLNLDKSINTSLHGYITRPDGSILGDLEFSKNGNDSYSANIAVAGAQGMGMAQGLWEAHIFAESNDKGLKVRRDAQTAFGVELNTARFNSKLKLTKQAIEIGIDVGVEGRYEVRAILMGTNESGVMQAIASTGSANWLQAGQQSITLKLDAKFIAESGLAAPYALKNVQLINQTYMAFVQTIKSGINITGFNFDFGRKIDFEGELRFEIIP